MTLGSHFKNQVFRVDSLAIYEKLRVRKSLIKLFWSQNQKLGLKTYNINTSFDFLSQVGSTTTRV